MKNKLNKSCIFYALFFCFILIIYSCGNKEEQVVRLDVNPKSFEVNSDSCTLVSTMNISEFKLMITSIRINGEPQDLDGVVIKKVNHKTFVSNWFEVKIADDYSNIKIQLKENTNTENRTLAITISLYGHSCNYLSINQKGKL